MFFDMEQVSLKSDGPGEGLNGAGWRCWTTGRGPPGPWLIGRRSGHGRKWCSSATPSPTPTRWVAALAGFDIVLAMRERTALPAATLQTARRSAAADVYRGAQRGGRCRRRHARGVLVCNTTSGPSHGTAELALALLLPARGGCPRPTPASALADSRTACRPARNLAGRTLGLVGLGRIGGRMGRYAQALDMKVIAWSQNLTDERAAEVGAERVAKDALFAPRRCGQHPPGPVGTDARRGGGGRNRPHAPGRHPGEHLTRPAWWTRRRCWRHWPRDASSPGSTCSTPNRCPPRASAAHRPEYGADAPHLGYVTGRTWPASTRASIENILAYLDGAPIAVVNPEVLG